MRILRKLVYILLSVMIVLPAVPAGSVKAVSAETATCIQNDACFYSEQSTQCVNGVGIQATIPGDNKLPSSVPAPYHDIFIAAANKEGAPAALVAAIFFAGEHASSWPNASGPWASSDKGASGPFQFIPSTWEAYKVDGDGDGKMDVQNLTDAAFGAAKYLAATGGKSGADDTSVRKAIFAYNHANWYVNNVLEAYHSFLVGGTGSTGNTSTGGSCGGNIGISADGFVFPQKTTKAQLKKNGWNPNCTNKLSEMGPGSKNPITRVDGLCHHDYLAADILNDSGVTVVSPRPGRVIRTRDSNTVGGASSGASVRIYSDPALGGDGLYYYLTHMLPKSKDSTAGIQVTEGQVITAGQVLGVVGTAADAQGTIPHTHFDVSPVDNGFKRDSSGTDGPLLDPQPVLKASYEALPDN